MNQAKSVCGSKPVGLPGPCPFDSWKPIGRPFALGDLGPLQEVSDGAKNRALRRTRVFSSAKETVKTVELYRKMAQLTNPGLIGLMGVSAKKLRGLCPGGIEVSEFFEPPGESLASLIASRQDYNVPADPSNQDLLQGEKLLRLLGEQISLGASLQKLGLFIGGVSPHSVFLKPDGSSRVVVAPEYLGAAKEIRALQRAKLREKSSRTLPPLTHAQLLQGNLEFQCDHYREEVFSLGVLLLEVGLGKVAESIVMEPLGPNPQGFLSLLSLFERKYRESAPGLAQLLQRMLQNQVEKRPDFLELEKDLNSPSSAQGKNFGSQIPRMAEKIFEPESDNSTGNQNQFTPPPSQAIQELLKDNPFISSQPFNDSDIKVLQFLDPQSKGESPLDDFFSQTNDDLSVRDSNLLMRKPNSPKYPDSPLTFSHQIKQKVAKFQEFCQKKSIDFSPAPGLHPYPFTNTLQKFPEIAFETTQIFQNQTNQSIIPGSHRRLNEPHSRLGAQGFSLSQEVQKAVDIALKISLRDKQKEEEEKNSFNGNSLYNRQSLDETPFYNNLSYTPSPLMISSVSEAKKTNFSHEKYPKTLGYSQRSLATEPSQDVQAYSYHSLRDFNADHPSDDSRFGSYRINQIESHQPFGAESRKTTLSRPANQPSTHQPNQNELYLSSQSRHHQPSLVNLRNDFSQAKANSFITNWSEMRDYQLSNDPLSRRVIQNSQVFPERMRIPNQTLSNAKRSFIDPFSSLETAADIPISYNPEIAGHSSRMKNKSHSEVFQELLSITQPSKQIAIDVNYPFFKIDSADTNRLHPYLSETRNFGYASDEKCTSTPFKSKFSYPSYTETLKSSQSVRAGGVGSSDSTPLSNNLTRFQSEKSLNPLKSFRGEESEFKLTSNPKSTFFEGQFQKSATKRKPNTNSFGSAFPI